VNTCAAAGAATASTATQAAANLLIGPIMSSHHISGPTQPS
jgi:hypothetical protein